MIPPVSSQDPALVPSRAPRSALLPLAAMLLTVLALYGAVLHEYARRFGGDYSALVTVGSRFAAPDMVGKKVWVFGHSFGYDGQFYLYAAHDPLISGRAAKHMDVPAYRYQRIAYPWLAWLAAAGESALLPRALVWVNLGAVLAGCLFLGLLARDQGRTPWWGLVYGLSCGLLLGLFRCLAEPVLAAFLAGALFFYHRRNYWGAALMLALAALGKEIALLAVGAMALAALLEKRGGRAAPWLALSALPLAAWWGFIHLRLGQWPHHGGTANFGPPLAGLWSYLSKLPGLPLPWAEKVFAFAFALVSLAIIVLSLWEVWRRRDAISLPLLAYAVFFSLMTDKVWVEPWSYGRVLLPLFLFALAAGVVNPSRPAIRLALVQAGLFPLLLWQQGVWLKW